MSAAIIIPARFGSTRLPGKPLLRETGKFLIQHVYERAHQSQLADSVVVATDDARILQAVESFGGHVVLTSPNHRTGTDRVAEVAQQLSAEIVLNVQGDEPLVDPQSLDLLIDTLRQNPLASMATLAVPIRSAEQWRDPNCVKVVCDEHGQALYFSRSPIPYQREGELDFSTATFLQHLGLYGYRREVLLELARWPVDEIEAMEQLEQLRALRRGAPIQLKIVQENGFGIDTPDDYRRFVQLWREQQIGKVA